MKRDYTFNTIAELKSFENVSPKVSDLYVPIYTSEIIKLLEPEFKFINGSRLEGSSSKHYVDFDHNGDKIRLYNSYDRQMAFQANLYSDGFIIDLGLDRLVHRGARAKNVAVDIKTFKEDVVIAVKTAKVIQTKFDTVNVDENIAKEISDMIFFKQAKIKGFQEYTNYMDILIPKGISLKAYITSSINKFIQGDYTVTINGSKRLGRPVSSTLMKIRIQNKIVKYLSAQFPEYFL